MKKKYYSHAKKMWDKMTTYEQKLAGPKKAWFKDFATELKEVRKEMRGKRTVF